MANQIVTTSVLSRNDISSLAKLLEIPFHYYDQHHGPLQQDYLNKLSTIVGLGFVAALVDGNTVTVYKNYLNVYQQQRDFKHRPEAIAQLATAIATMINWAAFLFRCLNYPGYYVYFAQLLEAIIKSISLGTYGKLAVGQKAEAGRLLQLIVPK